MSKLEDLIAELCPDGVEYRALAEIGEFFGGLTGKSKDDFSNGNCKFISYMNVFSNLSINIKTNDLVKIQEGEKQRIIKNGDIIFTGSSETPNECGMSSVFINDTDEEFYLNSFCFVLRLYDENILAPHFSKYLFRSNELRKQIIKTASGVTRFNVSKKKMEKVLVPLPPLPIQEEIVRILDNFTELTAELTARKQQYEYYRDSLLTFGDDVKRKTLGGITRIFSASRVHKNEWTTSGVPFYRTSDVISIFNGVENSRGKAFISDELYETLSSKSGKIQKNDILITGGGTIGIPYIVPTDEPLYVKDADLLCIQKSKTLTSKFLYHYFLTTKFRLYLDNITHNATIAHYTISQIANTPVPIPPLAEQERIVAILDRFDTLVNDITTGLPAEIEARKQQYEYYRDKLLTFKDCVS